jgi:[histone H3]-dimethyl-L-lysine9 demethylase
MERNKNTTIYYPSAAKPYSAHPPRLPSSGRAKNTVHDIRMFLIHLFQVSNQADCIKAAGDFLFPDHLEHCLRLTTEFREENLVEQPWMVDVLQVKRTVLHAYINIREQCMGLECSDLSSAGSEDYSMAIDDGQNSQQVYHSIPSSPGQFPCPQGPDSSAPSDLQDEEMTNVVSMAFQDALQSNSSSVKVSYRVRCFFRSSR